RRAYIPVGFMPPDIVCSDLLQLIRSDSVYHFGVLSSAMHMAWVRYVAGRLKSDYRYSSQIVYNNFPWPKKPTATRRATVETAAPDPYRRRRKTLCGHGKLFSRRVDCLGRPGCAQVFAQRARVGREWRSAMVPRRLEKRDALDH